MEQEFKRDPGYFPDLWDHGAAVRSLRLEHKAGSAHTKAGTDHAVDHAVYRPWRRLYQLFQVENLYLWYGNVLAWDPGLFRKGEQETGRDQGDP